MMKFLLGKWAMLFLMVGVFILIIPGILLTISGYDNIGDTLIICYCAPVLIWALLVLFIGLIEFVKEEFIQ